MAPRSCVLTILWQPRSPGPAFTQLPAGYAYDVDGRVTLASLGLRIRSGGGGADQSLGALRDRQGHQSANSLGLGSPLRHIAEHLGHWQVQRSADRREQFRGGFLLGTARVDLRCAAPA